MVLSCQGSKDMRIIAGSLGGRNFESVQGHRTHPMSEKIRGALFNTLGDITGLTVLDAYSGTGALSFEALSRGAAHATAIDADQKAASQIKSNRDILQIEEESIGIVRAYAHAWSRRHPNKQFDIVLLDPPYDAVEPKHLLQLANHAKPGGIIVLSLPPGNGFQYAPSRHELLSSKSYGDAELFFYRRSD